MKYLKLGAAVVGVVVSFFWLKPDSKVHVAFCNVGQGDGILVVYGQTQVLIDGGPSDSVLSCLSDYVPYWDNEIELVVLTNADSDHMTGLIEVLKRYRVEKLVTNHLFKDTARFEAFREAVISSGVSVYAPQQGDVIKVSTKPGLVKLEFEVLWPQERLGDKLVWSSIAKASDDNNILGLNSYSKTKGNDQSVVLAMHFGEFDALFTGDIGEEVEKVLAGNGVLEDVEVLKVGHHGSKFSSTSEFLDEIDAEVAVVSVGKNSYGHPTQEALARIENSGSKVIRTDTYGTVEIVSDGKNFWLSGD